MNGLKPCPFCNTHLRHVESLARSFNPPRIYHEYHHDNPKCFFSKFRWNFTNDTAAREAFLITWNTRAPEPLVAELIEALEECAAGLEAEIKCKRAIRFEITTERDLTPVRQAQAILAKAKGQS